jgi:hypothetical protein
VTHRDRIRLETLKLLVGVAWADREVAPEEIEHLMRLADEATLPELERDRLRRALADEGRFPAPDLALLRDHAPDVLRAVDELIAVDRRIAEHEVQVFRAIRALLAE